MTDPVRIRDLDAALRSLPRGAGVILRHYGAPDRTALARSLAAACRRLGLVFLVAGDWRLAARVNADGLHLPEHAGALGISSGGRLWRSRRGALLTVAAHSASGLVRARTIKASAALLSPVYPTPSHPDAPHLGVVRAALLMRRSSVPVLALGGMQKKHKAHVRALGFAGIAGIGLAVKEEN